jgi:hypothetical protein
VIVEPFVRNKTVEKRLRFSSKAVAQRTILAKPITAKRLKADLRDFTTACEIKVCANSFLTTCRDAVIGRNENRTADGSQRGYRKPGRGNQGCEGAAMSASSGLWPLIFIGCRDEGLPGDGLSLGMLSRGSLNGKEDVFEQPPAVRSADRTIKIVRFN